MSSVVRYPFFSEIKMASGVGLRYFIKVNLQIGGVSLYTLRLYFLYCSVNSVDTLTPVLTQLCAGGNGRTRRGSRTFHNARQTPPTPLCSPLQPVHLTVAPRTMHSIVYPGKPPSQTGGFEGEARPQALALKACPSLRPILL